MRSGRIQKTRTILGAEAHAVRHRNAETHKNLDSSQLGAHGADPVKVEDHKVQKIFAAAAHNCSLSEDKGLSEAVCRSHSRVQTHHEGVRAQTGSRRCQAGCAQTSTSGRQLDQRVVTSHWEGKFAARLADPRAEEVENTGHLHCGRRAPEEEAYRLGRRRLVENAGHAVVTHVVCR